MATSSIFTNIIIKNPKDAERFINALDESFNEPRRKSAYMKPPCRDKEKIRKIFSKKLYVEKYFSNYN